MSRTLITSTVMFEHAPGQHTRYEAGEVRTPADMPADHADAARAQGWGRDPDPAELDRDPDPTDVENLVDEPDSPAPKPRRSRRKA